MLLSLLPSMVSLNLEDKRSRYSLADVVHWEPAEMPNLVRLTLVGTPAISFHPDTLKSTRDLTHLILNMEHGDVYSYIPDPEEFEEVGQGEEASESDSDENNSLSSPSFSRRHPAWTWDWYLPKLTHLSLTSEFAYRFQFQMLAGTPNLAYFSVGIDSFSGKHKRTVGIADLIRPGFQHPAVTYVLDMEREQQEERKRLPYWDPEAYHPLGEEDGEEDEEAVKEKEDEEDEIWQEFEFLHISVMKDVFLIGPWMFDYRALKVLFGKVAPNIENLSLQGCYGFTVSGWVQSTSEHLHSLKS
ncbi:MAG: hypothetical protein J3R72DRAFT_436127 [Linnemannia gamsii]|nr:MAG: hypothetical protein J3R72DRAFT_436127 [Linnemannia gamsii]